MTPSFVLFTAFCMRLHMNHCYVEEMADRPFATLGRCEAEIETVNRQQFDMYYRVTFLDGTDGAIPMAHWCVDRNW